MKKTVLLFIVLFALSMSACTSWKKTLYSEGYLEEAIQNSIKDFTRCRLFKTDSSFHVSFEDMDGEFYLVRIMGSYGRTLEAYSDGRLTFSPTECMVADGKLFYWNNPRVERSEECVELLDHYGLIDSTYLKTGGYGTISLDETLEGADYYICPGNLRCYKRIISSFTPPGHPKLKCNKGKHEKQMQDDR